MYFIRSSFIKLLYYVLEVPGFFFSGVYYAKEGANENQCHTDTSR